MTASLSEQAAVRHPVGRVDTVPNAVTLARTLLALLLGVLALTTADPVLLGTAYAVYWAGDIADGWLARRLDQETRFGAVLDIICDRACTAVLCSGLVVLLPGAAPAAVVFLACFTVLDTMLSLAFVCWDIDTPNHFWHVDRMVHALNWSPLAKTLNTAAVVAAVLSGAHLLALAMASTVVMVKLWSAGRILTLLTAPHLQRA